MRRVLFAIPVLLVALCLSGPGNAAYVGWGCEAANGVMDSTGAYLMGDKTTTLDFSTGAYVQLIKLVGDVDNYLQSSIALADDILMGEATIGYRILGSGPASGRFSVTNPDMDLVAADVGVTQLYVRVFNVPKDEVPTAANLEAGISGLETVRDVMNPQTYFFNDIQTEPVPEPASLLLLVPGLAIWAIRRKK